MFNFEKREEYFFKSIKLGSQVEMIVGPSRVLKNLETINAKSVLDNLWNFNKKNFNLKKHK